MRYPLVSPQIGVLGSDAEPLRDSLIRRGNSIRNRDKRYRGLLWIRRLKVRILPPQPSTRLNWSICLACGAWPFIRSAQDSFRLRLTVMRGTLV
jgi:hypothetical protein